MNARAELTARLGRVGIWTRQFDANPGRVAERAAAEVEAMGWPSLWIPEAIHREVLTHASLLLAATERLAVATGIARVHARSPQATALAQRYLAERFPGRFLLGLGVSHPMIVERMLGQQYGPPLATMRAYLDSMDATRGGSRVAEPDTLRVLAALGPKMLRLSAERAGGAHTYVSTVEHTAWTRGVLGPDAFLAPCVKVVLTQDIAEGRAIGRGSVGPTIKNPAYHDNLLRSGFSLDDIEGGPSDAVVDALVAIGDEAAIAERVHEHLAAGADHVCIEVLTGDEHTIPTAAWQRLLPAVIQP